VPDSRRTIIARGVALGAAISILSATAAHASAAKLAADGQRALDRLTATEPKARLFRRNARAVLVFPTIIKGGLMFGAQTGNGVLFEHGKVAGYYNISAASFGLQAGGQSFSYALFFINDNALAYLRKSDGWALGTGPSVVVVNAGESREANTATLSQDVYAFPFAEKGLMAGIDIKGSKITRIHPK
jgi:lipid-binding SYLF domain-containing protein